VAMVKDPWALRANPSLAAMLSDRSLSASVSPSWLGVPELTRSSFLYVEPVGMGAISCSGTRFGFSLYRETDISVGFGSTPDDQFGYGVAVDLYHLRIERYGAAWAAGLSAGIFYNVSAEILFGFSASNVTASKIGSCHEKIPQVFSVGLGYRPTGDLDIGIDLVKDPAYPMEIRLGAECALLGVFSLRIGSGDQPSWYTAGVGITYAFFRMDYAITTHHELGLSHHFSISLFPGSL
jgi:hypothetical protein